MKKPCFLVLVLLPLTGCRLPTWQLFALDERVVVELPGRPQAIATQQFAKLKHPECMKAWGLRTLGGTYQLMRTVNPAARLGAGATREREAYYDRRERAFRKRNAQIFTSRSFTIGGVTGRELVYKSHATPVPTLIYSRTLALDSVSYTVNFTPAYPGGVFAWPGIEQRRRFFDSVRIVSLD